jgi:hypothetical protein
LGLPPRVVTIRRDYFSPEEKELYLSLFSDAKRQFNTYLDQGTILNSEYPLLLSRDISLTDFSSDYSNIFSLYEMNLLLVFSHAQPNYAGSPV